MSRSNKKFYLSSKDIRRLIDSEEGCIASDRITVDGCKVGYMYREDTSDSTYPDSGWRFLAGDENDAYMNNSDNHGIFQVNTICNYDLEIIPLLDSPPGTGYYRNEQGKFEIVDEE